MKVKVGFGLSGSFRVLDFRFSSKRPWVKFSEVVES